MHLVRKVGNRAEQKAFEYDYFCWKECLGDRAKETKYYRFRRRLKRTGVSLSSEIGGNAFT